MFNFTGKPKPASSSNGNSNIKDTTTQSFMQDVIEASKQTPVLVDFWAPWCGPCKQLTPIIEKTVNSYNGKVKLVKLNIDDEPAIPGQMGIQSIPAVVAFVDGRPADAFMGVVPESQIKTFIDGLLSGTGGNDDVTQLLEQAEKLFAAGDISATAEIYGAVFTNDQENITAISGLARCHVKKGNLELAKQTLDLIPEDKKNITEATAAFTAYELASQASELGDKSELEQKISQTPHDYQSRFDLAIILNTEGKKEEAVEHLLFIVKTDREWQEDGARKQLVKFFESWGAKDPATIAGRRKLSSALFS